MRVFIVTTIYKPHTGGSASYFELLIQEMIKSVEISGVYLLTEYVIGSPLVERVEKLTIIRLLMPRDGYRTFNLLYKCISYVIVQIQILTAIIVLKRKLEIIHVHSRTMNKFINSILKFSELPIIIDVRDNYYKIKNLSSANVVICASLNSYNTIRKKITKKDVRHIPIPINYDYLNRTIINFKRSPGDFRILFAATITENKGIRELIEAAKILSKKNYKFNLIIAGKNKLENNLLDDLPGYIIYKGELEQSLLYEEMRNCDIFILPSNSEGMPRVCLEAIALGKTTLVPPNIPEFIESCPDFIVNIIDSEYISNKIEHFLGTNQNNNYPIEIHSIEKNYLKTYEAYRSAIENKN